MLRRWLRNIIREEVRAEVARVSEITVDVHWDEDRLQRAITERQNQLVSMIADSVGTEIG